MILKTGPKQGKKVKYLKTLFHEKINFPFKCIVYVPRPENVNNFSRTPDSQHKDKGERLLLKLWGGLGQ